MQIVAIVHKYEVYNFNLSSSKLELGLALCASVSPFAVFSPLLFFFIITKSAMSPQEAKLLNDV